MGAPYYERLPKCYFKIMVAKVWTAQLERQWLDWGCFKADKRVQMLNPSSAPLLPPIYVPETASTLPNPPYQAHF